MDQVWAELVSGDHVKARGSVDGAAVTAHLRIIEGTLRITELTVTLDGGFLPQQKGAEQRTALPASITSDMVRSISFERIHQEARDVVTNRLPRLPDDAPFTAEALAEAAEERLSREWREARETAQGKLREDRSRRGRPTDLAMLRWLARRYVQLDHDPARPAIRRTLAREASDREGVEVSEDTIGKRLRRATELGLIVGREASRRGGSRLGPGYVEDDSQEGKT